MNAPWQNHTVLLREAVDALWDEADGPRADGVYVDATLAVAVTRALSCPSWGRVRA